MSRDAVQMLEGMLRMCRDQTLKVCEGVLPENRLVQIQEHKAHPLWLLGHLANTVDVVGNLWTYNIPPVVAKAYKFKFAPDFANGDPITPNAEDYPGWDQLMQDYALAFNAFLDQVKATVDADLPAAPRGPVREDKKDFFNSIGKNIQVMVLHDTHHRGQISMLAKRVG